MTITVADFGFCSVRGVKIKWMDGPGVVGEILVVMVIRSQDFVSFFHYCHFFKFVVSSSHHHCCHHHHFLFHGLPEMLLASLFSMQKYTDIL